MATNGQARGGRPRLSACERRSVRVTLGFTPDVAAVLLASAVNAGFSPRPVVPCLRLYVETFLSRHHRRLPPAPPPPIPPELVSLRLELQRLGNNLNQAVHIAHGTRAGLPTQTPALLGELLELVRTVQGLIERWGAVP